MNNNYVLLIVLVFVILVILALPKVDLGHTRKFRLRRMMNWLPLGLTYAFLYMGRYNLTVSKNALGDLMSKSDFGTIFFWGTLVYGMAFVVNGPLTDRIGGRLAILIGASGSALMNLLLGCVTYSMLTGGFAKNMPIVPVFSLLYAVNMYFQSFGAVSIVKVNASWFHLRERGIFGGIFGIIISLGIFLAFDIGRLIISNAPLVDASTGLREVWWVFWVPAIILFIFIIVDYFWIHNTPSDVGLEDFDTQDATSKDDGERKPVIEIFKMMFRNPVIVTIASIEFCSGFLRNAIMHWYIIFAKQTGVMDTFVPQNWGLLLFCAGVFGGLFAGSISDIIFHSRRGPVAAILYVGMIIGSLIVMGILKTLFIGWVVVFMSLCVIGVHGMLSGTASMDFGGKKNVGTAVGLIDGFVYLGTAFQAILLAKILPKGILAKDPSEWMSWPISMLIMSIVGFLFAICVWNAKVKSPDKKTSITRKE